MNHDNQNPNSWDYFWTEIVAKQYKEGEDYVIEKTAYSNKFNIISARLKKVYNEFYEKMHGEKYRDDCFIGELNWVEQEIYKAKWKEGVDYEIKWTNGIENIITISPALKKVMKEIYEKKFPRTATDDLVEQIINQVFLENPEARKRWEERGRQSCQLSQSEKRKQFIAENNPPQFWNVGIERNNYKQWISQQPPLTNAEETALNDPILEHSGHWARALWYIQKVRQAESDIFSDHDFAWGNFKDKELKDPTNSDYKAIQALKNAGISLDNLFARVEKGRQVQKQNDLEKPHKNKEKILTHIDDWILFGPNAIYNQKTLQGLELRGENMTRFQFHDEEVKVNEEELIDSRFDAKTFSEIRVVIFNNLLKNLRAGKFLSPVSKNHKRNAYEKNNFSSAEWTEIEKYLDKRFATSHGDNNKNNNVSPIIVIAIIGLILVIGGLLAMKNRQKKGKHGSKR